MADFSKSEVDALTKTLWALSARRMEAQYRLKLAHRSEDPLGSRCLQLHHEKSLAAEIKGEEEVERLARAASGKGGWR